MARDAGTHSRRWSDRAHDERRSHARRAHGRQEDVGRSRSSDTGHRSRARRDVRHSSARRRGHLVGAQHPEDRRVRRVPLRRRPRRAPRQHADEGRAMGPRHRLRQGLRGHAASRSAVGRDRPRATPDRAASPRQRRGVARARLRRRRRGSLPAPHGRPWRRARARRARRPRDLRRRCGARSLTGALRAQARGPLARAHHASPARHLASALAVRAPRGPARGQAVFPRRPRPLHARRRPRRRDARHGGRRDRRVPRCAVEPDERHGEEAHAHLDADAAAHVRHGILRDELSAHAGAPVGGGASSMRSA